MDQPFLELPQRQTVYLHLWWMTTAVDYLVLVTISEFRTILGLAYCLCWLISSNFSLYFRVLGPNKRNQVLSGIYNGEEVSVYAHFSSGGYAMIMGIILAFSLTVPGAVLSSAFYPASR